MEKKKCCSEKIGGDKTGNNDPDHSEEARAFYADFWGKTLSDRASSYDGAVGNYRGDTIISFNRMAGCLIRLLPVYSNGLQMPRTQSKRLEIINDVFTEKNNLKYFERFSEKKGGEDRWIDYADLPVLRQRDQNH